MYFLMGAQIVYQEERKATYNGKRVYIDSDVVKKGGLEIGEAYETDTKPEEHEVLFAPSETGKNKVSYKTRSNGKVPVIDKCGKEIREALEGCQHIILYIVEDKRGKGQKKKRSRRIIIKGIQTTAAVKRGVPLSAAPLRTISFCAGAGVSTEAMKQAGFQEVAGVEWNQKEGSENKFASLYEKNHPESMLFNVPMERLKGEHLPYADVWLATLDCTDYSKASNGTGKEIHTIHLFMHLMRLFWEKPKEERPIAVLVENVPEFEKIAGRSLELCFREEGYHFSSARVNSLHYGARTKRERYFVMASLFEGFTFPEGIGEKQIPIINDGTISLEELEWVTPEEHGTLRYFLERQKKAMSHNHVMTVFDVTKDAYIGTITKSHHKIQPENWIKHPEKPNTYAYLKAEQVAALQEIPSHLYLGDSNKLKVESIGQSVCFTSFKEIAKQVYHFLSGCIEALKEKREEQREAVQDMCCEQLSLVL